MRQQERNGGVGARRLRNYRIAVIVMAAVLVIAAVTAVLALLAWRSQTRLNRFTRNILLSDTLFLRRYTDAENGGSESTKGSFGRYESQRILGAVKDCDIPGEAAIFRAVEDYFQTHASADAAALAAIWYRALFYEPSFTRDFPYPLFPDALCERYRTLWGDGDTITDPAVLQIRLAMLLEGEAAAGEGEYPAQETEEAEADYYDGPSFFDLAGFAARHCVPLTDEASLIEAYYLALGTACEFHGITLPYAALQSALQREADACHLLDVGHLCQNPDYPNGCEAFSAVMIARHAGIGVEAKDFIERFLPCGEVKIRFGVRFGPDPAQCYAGDPASLKGGWGCFAPVIVQAMRDCFAAYGSTAEVWDLTGITLQELCHDYLDYGIPAAVWVTTDFRPVDEVYQWLSADRTQAYLYPKNQHCAVLIGYDADSYYFCDPLSAQAVTAVGKKEANDAYTSMGRQAVIVRRGA